MALFLPTFVLYQADDWTAMTLMTNELMIKNCNFAFLNIPWKISSLILLRVVMCSLHFEFLAQTLNVRATSTTSTLISRDDVTLII
jgi:hypothetical protein